MLINNGLDWRVVTYRDGNIDLKHVTALSDILECGRDPIDYDIEEIEQCWNGEDLGEVTE